ncbi:MAG TPA: hypothetical protein VMF58_16020 [Rhizomicrobium sp.]|nr:hypothetical protein [Rhizomicrobium sp.]
MSIRWKVTSLTFALCLGLPALCPAHAAGTFCPVDYSSCRGRHLHSKDGQIRNVCDLQAMQTAKSQTYSVVPEGGNSEIDASCTSKWNGLSGFIPIAGYFNGLLKGNGVPINGLMIHSSASDVGLFSRIGSQGRIENLALTNVDIAGGGASIGAVAGENYGSISFVYVTGCIANLPGCFEDKSQGSSIGGLVRGNNTGGTIKNSFFNGKILSGGSAGGIADLNTGVILNSGVSGSIQSQTATGGLLGTNFGGRVSYSYSVADVTTDGALWYGGGFVFGTEDGSIQHSYSTGSVSGSTVGGFATINEKGDAKTTITTEVFATGLTNGGQAGGLVQSSDPAKYQSAYWDMDTTEQPSSAGGKNVKRLHTADFKAALPKGFGTNDWANSPGDSYPFLIPFNCVFPQPPGGSLKPSNCTYTDQPVATETCPKLNTKVPEPMYFCDTTQMMATFQPLLSQYANPTPIKTFIPASQLQLFQYYNPENGIAAGPSACFATVYTMVARMIGFLYPDATVGGLDTLSGITEKARDAHIDSLLNADGEGFWPPSLKKSIADWSGWTDLTDDNAAAALVESGHPLYLHGAVNGKFPDHVMLVTSVLRDQAGKLIRFVAIDPEIGQQVFINLSPDPSYHQAVLEPFTVTDAGAYQKLTAFHFKADKYKYLIWK